MGRFCVISGDDDFAVKERTRQLACELAGGNVEDNPAVEIVSGDNESLKSDEILAGFLNALRTPPFLCDTKLVWLRHFDLAPFFSKEPTGSVAACVELLSSPLAPELSVLIDGPGLDLRRTLTKNWKSAGAEFTVLNAAKSTDRKFADNRKLNIRELCERSGKSIEPGAVQYLTETIGGDSGLLTNEIEKLCCYIGGNSRITLADCQAVCSRTPETVSWEFTGAIVARNTELALKLLDILLQTKDAEMRLMATLSGEFQKLIQTRLAMKQLNLGRVGPGTFDSIPEETRQRFPENPLLKLHPFRAYKICEGAANFSDPVLARDLELVRDTARSLVSGGDRRMSLEQLVIKLTSH